MNNPEGNNPIVRNNPPASPTIRSVPQELDNDRSNHLVCLVLQSYTIPPSIWTTFPIYKKSLGSGKEHFFKFPDSHNHLSLLDLDNSDVPGPHCRWSIRRISQVTAMRKIQVRREDDIRAPIINYGASASKLVYGVEDVIMLGEWIVQSKIPFMIYSAQTDNTPRTFRLTCLAAYLVPLPDFPHLWASYLDDPDDGVSLVEEAKYDTIFNSERIRLRLSEEEATRSDDLILQSAQLFQNWAKEYFGLSNIFNIDNQGSYTKAEMDCLIIVIILSSVKVFTENAHFRTYITKRLGAYCAMKGYDGIVTEQQGSLLHNVLNAYDHFSQLAKSLHFYPKFKSLLFKLVLNLQDDMGPFLKNMLKDSQLSVFGFIADYILDGPVTRAHMMTSFLTDSSKYMAVAKNLRKKLGDLYPYFKLIDPTNNETAVSNFPTLAAMAVVWHFKQFGQGVGGGVYFNTSLRFPKSLLDNMKHVVKADYYTTTRTGMIPATYTEEEKEILREFGVNYERIIADGSSAYETTGEDLEAIANMLSGADRRSRRQ